MFHKLCLEVEETGNANANRVCPICDMAFKVPIGLKMHLITHTAEKPFLCLHCWRSFSSHIDLKLHIRKEHLSHLEPPPKPTKRKSSAAPKVKQEAAGQRKSYGKKYKQEASLQEQQQIFALAGDDQQLVALDASAAAGLPENMELVVANHEGEEGQTILLNSDGTILQTGDQDMIVVIQGDDDETAEAVAAAGHPGGLLVVDSSQLRQVMGEDGVPVTLVEANGETMILEDDGAAGAAVAAEAGTKVLLGTQQPDGTTTYALADAAEAGEEGQQVLLTEDGQAIAATTGVDGSLTTTMIVTGGEGTTMQPVVTAAAAVNGVEALTAAASVVSQDAMETNQEAEAT